MPIEFTCSGCGGTLRVPDTAAGKQAQCPTCQTVLGVPAATAESSFTPPAQGSFAAPEGNPFGESTSGGFDSQNPYASPLASTSVRHEVPVGDLRHEKISFDSVPAAWSVLSQQMGTCVLFALAVVGISLVGQFIAGILNIAVTMFVPLLGAFLAQVVGQVVNAITTCMSILFGLAMMRGNYSPFDVAFKIGPHYLKVLGLSLLVFFVMVLAYIACLVPITLGMQGTISEEVGIAIGLILGIPLAIGSLYFSLASFLAGYFIVERGSGVIESIRLSFSFMRGNKLMLFLIMLVVGIVGSLITVFTCLIGLLFVLPFVSLLVAAIYMQATGQPISGGPQVQTPPSAQY